MSNSYVSLGTHHKWHLLIYSVHVLLLLVLSLLLVVDEIDAILDL